MKKTYQKAFINIAILVVIVVAAVGSGGYYILKNKSSDIVINPEPTPGVEPSASPSPSTSPSTKPLPLLPAQSKAPEHISKAHNTFGFNIFKSIATENIDNENIFISPTSIALALSMVYNGAAGDTKIGMEKTLEVQGLDIATINEESLGLMNLLKNPDPKIALSIANSIWAQKGFTFKQSFLTEVGRYFKAEIATLDFKAKNAAETINAWVNKNTNGKITSIVPDPIPKDMVMYLINAVYFKGSWTKEFDKKLTENRDFTKGDGTIKKHPLMLQRGEFSYLETPEFQSVVLPYGDEKVSNGRLSMYVFLPSTANVGQGQNQMTDKQAALTNFEQNLNAAKWTEWMTRYQKMDGTILLPKFTSRYEASLVDVLTKLGMGKAFSDGADLSGMADAVKISSVIHKTFVDVNEEGTEAAAVTGIGVSVTSVMPPQKTFYMEVNRPFFFAIRDNETDAILFMGEVKNP